MSERERRDGAASDSARDEEADLRAIDPPWSDAEASLLAEDVHLGNHATCPACGSWVHGTIVGSVPALRKPVELECEGCGRIALAFARQNNEGRRVDGAVGQQLEEARQRGAALVCPFCTAAMRLLRDELPDGREIFAFDCLACGASYFEAGGVL